MAFDSQKEIVIRFFTDPKAFNKGIDAMVGKMNKYSNKLKMTGKQMQSMGKSAMKWGGLMAAPLVLATKKAADFQIKFNEVRTLLDDVTEGELKDLRNGILDMSVELGETIPNSTRAVYQALSASIPKENVLSFVEVAGKAAIAGMSDTATSVEV